MLLQVDRALLGHAEASGGTLYGVDLGILVEQLAVQARRYAGISTLAPEASSRGARKSMSSVCQTIGGRA